MVSCLRTSYQQYHCIGDYMAARRQGDEGWSYRREQCRRVYIGARKVLSWGRGVVFMLRFFFSLSGLVENHDE